MATKLTLDRRVELVAKRAKKLEGMTANQIARFLWKNKIKGELNEPTKCALAVYLNYKCSVEGLAKATLKEGRKVRVVNLPAGTEDFVENFDMGGYPKLVLKKKEAK